MLKVKKMHKNEENRKFFLKVACSFVSWKDQKLCCFAFFSGIMFFLKLFLEKHFFNENLTNSFDRDHCISLQDIQGV